MSQIRVRYIFMLLAVVGLGGLSASTALAAGPPPAATAFSTAVLGPSGGSITGFGITATFAAGALAQKDLVILGNWPNGQDITPPIGQPVKTFSLQVCDDASGTPTDCTSEFGNFPNSPAGTERIDGMSLPYLPGGQTGVNFGAATNKLVTITVETGGSAVYIYDPNFSTTQQAYPKLLPSTVTSGVLTFQTFQPIVWTVTSSS
ncbi:MAG: hypothetical protein M0027_05850 [Candidatus Dormibacteraeota bacterium]|jgi:hypothetical protein|nr:hypothetical protein [Candidatus Dormibacteraeota bacterium]